MDYKHNQTRLPSSFSCVNEKAAASSVLSCPSHTTLVSFSATSNWTSLSLAAFLACAASLLAATKALSTGIFHRHQCQDATKPVFEPIAKQEKTLNCLTRWRSSTFHVHGNLGTAVQHLGVLGLDISLTWNISNPRCCTLVPGYQRAWKVEGFHLPCKSESFKIKFWFPLTDVDKKLAPNVGTTDVD